MRPDNWDQMSWAARNRYYARLNTLRKRLPDLEPHVALEQARRIAHEIPFDPPEVIAARRAVLETLTLPASLRKRRR